MRSQAKNKDGGIDPASPEQVKKFAHADLITLPPDVPGTTCSSCRFMANYQGKHVCLHEDLRGHPQNVLQV
jgi:hypothetical protein